MLKRHTIFIVIAILLAFTAGCAEKPPASVDGREISDKALSWHLKEKLGQHQARGAGSIGQDKLRKAVLQQLISERLLVQGAMESGISFTKEEVQKEYQHLRARVGAEAFDAKLKAGNITEAEFTAMLADRLMANKFVLTLVEPSEITGEMVSARYQETQVPFLSAETVNLRFIQTSTKEEAEDIIKELGTGRREFDSYAEELGGKGKVVVSATSWVNPDLFRVEMAKALKSIKVGGYGGPFEAAEGYYIFKINERELQRIKSLEEATPEIRAMLMDRKRQGAMAHWLSKQRAKAKVVIN